MMRAGRLDRRIDIERKTVTHSPSGQPVETWSLVSRRSASVTPLSGDERFSAPQYVAREQVQFEIRWSADVATVQPKDRIVYPAIDTSLSPAPVPAERDIYDIFYIAEVGRRRGLRIVAVRRADVS
jgi:SPP1 family predicted phage head-tail adaptor